MLETRTSQIRPYVEAAVLVALAAVLSNIVLFRAPLGGSVTLGGSIPICFVALRWGPKIGVLAGLNYGLVNFLMSGAVVGIGPFFCDYVFAGMSLAVAGFFPQKQMLAVVLAQLFRLFFYVLSGVLYFSQGKSWDVALLFSLQYNLAFLVPDTLIGLYIFHQVYRSGVGKTAPLKAARDHRFGG